MSNNQDLIQTLEKTISESQKNIRVLNAVKDTDHFIIVSIEGNTITSTTSDGMNVSGAVAALSAAIRSYSEKLEQPEDLNALLSIINTEVDQISRRVQELEEQERTEYESQYESQMVQPEPIDATLHIDAPARARPATKRVPRK
ncbi:MAG: hypothetical protein KIG60_01040 [Caryophanon sp.]|nr:hypothetical protein [Caryophanon sp.]